MGTALVGLENERRVMETAVKARRPLLCIGETGTGKTSLAQEVLSAACPAGVVRVNLNGGTTPDELEGRFQLRGQETYFQYGVLVEAMRHGMGLILDELNAALPDTLFVIHAALEQPPRLYVPETGDTIVPHPDFCVVATMNPSHTYAGTKGLNLALYSRFAAVLRFESLTGPRLLQALESHYPTAPTPLLLQVGDVIDQLTKLRREEKITTPIGIREALAAIGLVLDGLTFEAALVTAITHKLDPSEWPALASASVLSIPSKDIESTHTIREMLALAKETAAQKKLCRSLEASIKKYEKICQALREAGAPIEEPGKGDVADPKGEPGRQGDIA